MIINYFDKFNIDTSGIEEKLSIISTSKTENASYISHMLINALKYLFTETDYNTDNLYKWIPQNLKNVDTIVYFDNISDNKVLEELDEVKLIIIGNHLTHKINENIECINIKEFRKIKQILKNARKVYVGFNAGNIDYSRYYYNKMRIYFLNVLNSLNEISIEDLRNNIEEICTKILLKEQNFKSNYILENNKISFKEMIKIYSKIIKLKNIYKIEDRYLFYTSNDILNNMAKEMLNELSTLVEILNIEDKKEKYSTIYDITCERMSNEIQSLNYCNFRDNKCVTMRYTDGFPNSKENGCCNNTYMDKGKNCRYLRDDHSCSICSISCRVFTCKYLQDRGIDHALWQYPLIDLTIRKNKKAKNNF